MPKHILIIGHGYVGAALAGHLHRGGYAVTAIQREPSNTAPYLILNGDVSQLVSVESIASRLSTPPDVIVHCASSSRGGPDAYRSVFVDGTRHLVATFPDTPIIFTSSTSVYGQTDGSTVTETSPTAPDRETSQILLMAESLICSHGGTALRIAGIYGPARSVYLKRILDGGATIESGAISRCLNQIHRDDVVGAIAFLIGAPQAGEIFNVSDDEPLTQRACYERLAEMLSLPTPPEIPPNTNRKRAWTHKIVSNDKLKELGWTPRFPSFLDAITEDERLLNSFIS